MRPMGFDEIMREGATAANAHFRVWRLPGDAELGLIIPARVGNSVVRHRLARLVRATLESDDGRVVVLATPRAAELRGHRDLVARRLEPLLRRVR